jgi:hypothetical protein
VDIRADDSLRPVLSRFAARLVTAPMAFVLANVFDTLAYALGSLRRRAFKRRMFGPPS